MNSLTVELVVGNQDCMDENQVGLSISLSLIWLMDSCGKQALSDIFTAFLIEQNDLLDS